MIRITEAISRAAAKAMELNCPPPVIETDERTARLLGDLICQDIQMPLIDMVNPKLGDGVIVMFDGVKIKVKR